MVNAGVAAIHTFTNTLVYICNIFSPVKVEEKKFGGVYYNCYTLWPLRRTKTHTVQMQFSSTFMYPSVIFPPPVSRGNNEHIMAWHCTMNNTAQENPFRKVDTKERFILF